MLLDESYKSGKNELPWWIKAVILDKIEKCKGEHMLRKGSLTGLLLFGIFFGAGNLIFPPTLGAQSGSHFWPAIGGFVLSHETWNKRHITLIEN